MVETFVTGGRVYGGDGSVKIATSKSSNTSNDSFSKALKTGVGVTRVDRNVEQTNQYIQEQAKKKGIDTSGMSRTQIINALNKGGGSSTPTKSEPFIYKPSDIKAEADIKNAFGETTYKKGTIIYSGSEQRQLTPQEANARIQTQTNNIYQQIDFSKAISRPLIKPSGEFAIGSKQDGSFIYSNNKTYIPLSEQFFTKGKLAQSSYLSSPTISTPQNTLQRATVSLISGKTFYDIAGVGTKIFEERIQNINKYGSFIGGNIPSKTELNILKSPVIATASLIQAGVKDPLKTSLYVFGEATQFATADTMILTPALSRITAKDYFGKPAPQPIGSVVTKTEQTLTPKTFTLKNGDVSVSFPNTNKIQTYNSYSRISPTLVPQKSTIGRLPRDTEIRKLTIGTNGKYQTEIFTSKPIYEQTRYYVRQPLIKDIFELKGKSVVSVYNPSAKTKDILKAQESTFFVEIPQKITNLKNFKFVQKSYKPDTITRIAEIKEFPDNILKTNPKASALSYNKEGYLSIIEQGKITKSNLKVTIAQVGKIEKVGIQTKPELLSLWKSKKANILAPSQLIKPELKLTTPKTSIPVKEIITESPRIIAPYFAFLPKSSNISTFKTPFGQISRSEYKPINETKPNYDYRINITSKSGLSSASKLDQAIKQETPLKQETTLKLSPALAQRTQIKERLYIPSLLQPRYTTKKRKLRKGKNYIKPIKFKLIPRPDWLSVTISRARYGTATAPKITPKYERQFTTQLLRGQQRFLTQELKKEKVKSVMFKSSNRLI